MTETNPIERLSQLKDELSSVHGALRARRVTLLAELDAINAELPPEKKKRTRKAEPKAPAKARKGKEVEAQ